jgi:hypothetical protein
MTDLSKPRVHLIHLDTGDVALVVNGILVDFAEPSMDDCDRTAETAANLAGAIAVTLEETRAQVPADKRETWTWADLIEEFKW